MTIDEAIQHCEEVAKEQDKLCKRYDDASGYTRSHNEDIRTTDAKKCAECAEEYRQLAEWLKGYKRLLEQEPCEDAVSRQAVLEKLHEYFDPLEDGEDVCPADVYHEIKVLPSVTPQLKTGHWIMPVQDDGMSEPICYQVRCSECGFDLDPQTWHMELYQYGADKYCPNCGAKMESEGKE